MGKERSAKKDNEKTRVNKALFNLGKFLKNRVGSRE
jgi:hypothetical protein